MKIEPTWREFVPTLAPRERQTFLLVGQGLSNDEIALVMKISPLTVRCYVKRIHDKLYIEGRAALAIAGYQYTSEISLEGRI